MSETVKDFDFSQIFATERRILKLCGTYPEESTKCLNIRMLKQFLLWLMTIIHTVSMCMLVRFDTVRDILEPSLLLILEAAFIGKMIALSFNRFMILDCEKVLKRPTFVNFPRENMKSIDKNSAAIKNLGNRYRMICVVYIIGAVALSIINTNDNCLELCLPTPSWQPFDLRNKINYWSVIVFQTVALIISAANNTGIDIMFYKLCIILSFQLDILKGNLNRINYENSEDDIRKKLNHCIVHHYDILELYKYMDKVYSGISFVQCAASVLCLCSAVFQIIVMFPFGSEKFWTVVVYIVVILVQIGWYCWYAQRVTIRSTELGEAFYMTNWYESNTNVKKIMFIFMEKTKQPILFKAGGIFILSLGTLVTILRSSYSYAAVLQRMYKE